jgi:hypothetical protein
MRHPAGHPQDDQGVGRGLGAGFGRRHGASRHWSAQRPGQRRQRSRRRQPQKFPSAMTRHKTSPLSRQLKRTNIIHRLRRFSQIQDRHAKAICANLRNLWINPVTTFVLHFFFIRVIRAIRG